MRPDDGRSPAPIRIPPQTNKENDMTNHTEPGARAGSPRGPRGLTAIIAALVLVLAFALAACGGDDSDSASGSSGSSSSSGSSDSAGVKTAKQRLEKYKATPTEITITDPLKSAPPKGKKIVMLASADPNNVKIQKSLKSLAAEAGWTYEQVSYDPANIATFNQAVNSALTKGADYVAEAGIPLTPAITKKVKDGGAKWVLTSVHPADVKDPVIVDANAYANDELMGKVLADFFVSDSNGKGNVLVEHVPAYPILGGFTDGFQAEVKELCPDCKVKIQDITIPDLVAGKVPSVLVSALRKSPDTNYLAFDVGPFAAGIDSALSAAGLSSKVKIIGEAADEAGIAALKSGKHTAWTGFDPVYSTYVMMDAMFRDSLGMPIDQEKSGIQTTQILTKDTVGDYDRWSEPEDALDQFKKLWQIGQ
jgi:ribose transport system substrate-binding protein